MANLFRSNRFPFWFSDFTFLTSRLVIATTESLSIESPVLCGYRLIISAEKDPSKDRWSQVVELVDQHGTKSEIMRSIEGSLESDTESADWPPSPPLQEINLHELGSSSALLGVGMAGKSHWSASVSTENEIVVSDLACLVKEDDSTNVNWWLGSTYRVDSKWTITVDSEKAIKLTLSENDEIFVIVKAKKVADFDSMICVLAESSGGNESVFQIVPGARPNQIIKGQNRWCFEISLGKNS